MQPTRDMKNLSLAKHIKTKSLGFFLLENVNKAKPFEVD
jgi:hypothetical protein